MKFIVIAIGCVLFGVGVVEVIEHVNTQLAWFVDGVYRALANPYQWR